MCVNCTDLNKAFLNYLYPFSDIDKLVDNLHGTIFIIHGCLLRVHSNTNAQEGSRKDNLLRYNMETRGTT